LSSFQENKLRGDISVYLVELGIKKSGQVALFVEIYQSYKIDIKMELPGQVPVAHTCFVRLYLENTQHEKGLVEWFK
jgi:hypothetical protein